MRRVLVGELMDEPGVSAEDLDLSLRYIRWVNRRLGGSRGLLRHLQAWSARWPRDRPVTLLDIATGSADIPIAARTWAVDRGFDLRITALDLHPTTLDLARRHVAKSGVDGITLLQADALRLMDPYGPDSFDYVHAGMFLHHLGQIEVLTVLRIMDRLARAGFVWNDLIRSRLAAAAVNVFLIGQPHIIRHDARASIRAAFTRADALDAARRVGITYARYRTLLGHRFTLAGEKPGAW